MRIEELDDYGFDTKTALVRFSGNSEIYKRLLLMYFDDKNFETLETALKENDVETAFRAAHTLKGVAGNLSMIKLFGECDMITEFLRSKEMDRARQHFYDVKKAHDLACEGLSKIK